MKQSLSRKDHSPQYKLKMIMAKTIKNGTCLEWAGNYFKKYGTRGYKNDHLWAYPYIYYKSKAWRGNRLVMFLIHGSLPNGKCVLHHCDNNKCVNPDHLYFGTQKENAKDCVIRKRHNQTNKTHCKFGHPYNDENTLITKRKDSTYRRCRICISRYNRKARSEKA